MHLGEVSLRPPGFPPRLGSQVGTGLWPSASRANEDAQATGKRGSGSAVRDQDLGKRDAGVRTLNREWGEGTGLGLQPHSSRQFTGADRKSFHVLGSRQTETCVFT